MSRSPIVAACPGVSAANSLVARVDRGELVVDVAERVALPDLASVHDRAAAGTLPGKVVVVLVDPEP